MIKLLLVLEYYVTVRIFKPDTDTIYRVEKITADMYNRYSELCAGLNIDPIYVYYANFVLVLFLYDYAKGI